MKQMPKDNFQREYPPYTLTIKKTSDHFGLSERLIYWWMQQGILKRSYHFMKIGRRTLIVRKNFVELLGEIDRCEVSW